MITTTGVGPTCNLLCNQKKKGESKGEGGTWKGRGEEGEEGIRGRSNLYIGPHFSASLWRVACMYVGLEPMAYALPIHGKQNGPGGVI